ncbi:MAG: nickel pincer cofactor biosynthesis protein LarB [Candidatus Eremiobacteraeota bacterium]|nr:nickel pincer cofactor biosynthesis protein LarB [Candidatus Eremiobacteraeota bacterium]MBC5802384.1 nickel pincer cofactor biosynthesis protein LarB [Candidatus Eremiobacteraeota bacterium]MBC5820602.1 nickel pincer cofactor biosynthesis protein LarB [Candidatus Eremiobacteraeota bacterium]
MPADARGTTADAAVTVRLDHARAERTALPEVVYGAGKTRAQVAAIMREFYALAGFALATRVAQHDGVALAAELPEASYDEVGRVLRCGARPRSGITIAVACAGTSDLPVAREAACTLDALGHDVVERYDVGVAGVHRTLSVTPALDACRVVIVAAGMEGALPSVIAGLVKPPVIAVPTSVGYGAAFDGLAALLAMLNACAPGISVVNIDNGFGAAAVAHKIVSAC